MEYLPSVGRVSHQKVGGTTGSTETKNHRLLRQWLGLAGLCRGMQTLNPPYASSGCTRLHRWCPAILLKPTIEIRGHHNYH